MLNSHRLTRRDKTIEFRRVVGVIGFSKLQTAVDRKFEV